MAVGSNADSNLGEKKMEGEDNVRTVDCLRGRLLAERMASRNANQEAEQLGNKLMELETLLRQEAKSRKRAEKKLKFLLKKLQSMNISYVSDESEYSDFLMEKSDISSVSSTTSSITKENYENYRLLFKNQESEKNGKLQKGSENLQQNDSQNSSDEKSTSEESSSSVFEVNLQELKEPNEDPRLENLEQNIAHSQLGSTQNYDDSSRRSSTKEGLNQEDDQNPESQIDNSMALVLVDMSQKNHRVDPEVLDASVKEVLDALRYAKEQLQSSMERRKMNTIRVG